MLGSRKLLRLEVMLAGRPDPALQFDGMGREIGQTAVRLANSIKDDLLHLLFFLFTCEPGDDF